MKQVLAVLKKIQEIQSWSFNISDAIVINHNGI